MPLTVHYRSGHPSLIAVSNELFYNGTLTSFPSAHGLGAPPAPLLLPQQEQQMRKSPGVVRYDDVVEIGAAAHHAEAHRLKVRRRRKGGRD